MKNLKELITRKYLIGIIVIGLLDTLSFASLLITISKSEDLAYYINISGRQRMLSQRIALFLHQIEESENPKITKHLKDEVITYIGQFEKAHTTLSGKNSKYYISPEVLFYYREKDGLEKEVQYFLTQSRQLLKNPEALTSQQLFQFTEFIKYKFLNHLDRAVKLFEEQSNRLEKRLIQTEVILYMMALITLWLVVTFILIPLRDTILQRDEELEKLIEKLKNEGEYKSMFLANMSHELRTPLNGVLGVTDLLKSSQLTKDQINLLEIIEESGASLLNIINDILDLTKLEMGQFEIEENAFSPEDMLNLTYQTFKYQANSAHIDWLWKNETLPEALIGDEYKIKQILNNLISNALKFTLEGKVILISFFDDFTSHLIIKVQDTGEGISSEKLELIFDPFKQADSSTTRLHGGTGLGLSISKQLTQCMGGTLSAESKLGEGSTFTLSIPLKRASASEIKDKAHTKRVEKEKLKGHILVVDDNEINRRLMKKILERFNLTVSLAVNGQHALEMILENEYNLVLLDYHMPLMNGQEVMKTLKERKAQVPPVILLTADTREEIKKTAREVGVINFLEKPIQKAELQEKLSLYLPKADA